MSELLADKVVPAAARRFAGTIFLETDSDGSAQVDTYEEPETGKMYQVSESLGLYRVRQPVQWLTEEELSKDKTLRQRYPEYGFWIPVQ